MKNREIDKQIADFIGLDVVELHASPYSDVKDYFYAVDYHTCVPVPQYTNDIKAAWEVLEEMDNKVDPIKNHFYELLGTKVLHMNNSDAAEFICKCVLEVL